MIHIETPRLHLRDWTEADLDSFRLMNADERVMRFFPSTLSISQTDAFYQAILAEFKERGYGLYAAEWKESREFIGFIGFHRASFEADFTPCVEIGWRLKHDAWGLGCATEGAAACLRHGFAELGFREVFSFTAKINAPSSRVMEKIGMSFVKTFDHPKVEPGSPLRKHVLYRIASL